MAWRSAAKFIRTRSNFGISRRESSTRLMRIEAPGPKRTTKPVPGRRNYPYLLRDLPIERPNQV
jgi:hypothetical protein